MDIKDLILTPFYLIFFTLMGYMIRPYVTNKTTRKFFIPALWVRFIGAIALGLIYQFYYGGGDTFGYFEHGSRWIWEAFNEDVVLGVKLLLDSGGNRSFDETYSFSSKIWYYRDTHSYVVVRIVAFFDLFTFHTYSASALFFAVFSFSGLWAMYSALNDRYSGVKYLHVAILFIPSVVFWGSGILKDTITLGALGWITWSLLNLIFLKKRWLLSLIVMVLMAILILRIKSYILLCYAPVIFVLIYLKYVKQVRNMVLKVLLTPVLFAVIGGMGFLAVNFASTDEYNIDNIAKKAAVTAYDIRYGWGARSGGDGGYDIGLPDGTWQSMVKLMPAAINVSLFRPYIWEVRNPLMLLSAIESTIILFLAIRVFRKRKWKQKLKDPFLVFCLGFTLLFAFAVGVSTFNFGTLMRYKIPMMPFLSLLLLDYYKTNVQKISSNYIV
ncbi:hypothetical protein [Ekhidna sp.]|uniref:hypothetical protein n=1 Tax=Ekhidna sp. TaxID=2608089 RepID=UPI003BAA881E